VTGCDTVDGAKDGGQVSFPVGAEALGNRMVSGRGIESGWYAVIIGTHWGTIKKAGQADAAPAGLLSQRLAIAAHAGFVRTFAPTRRSLTPDGTKPGIGVRWGWPDAVPKQLRRQAVEPPVTEPVHSVSMRKQ